MIRKVNRLASLLVDFSDKFELPSRIDPDSLGADLGIPHRDKTIFAGYAFDSSEDRYEFGAALGQVDRMHISKFSSEVLTSEPISGITERVDGQGRFLVLGSRDGLKNQSDAEIQRGYLDDVSRISKSYDQFRELSDRILGKDT